MARIAIIKLFCGMTLSAAQLAGELKSKGHKPLVVNFKEQLAVDWFEREDPQYQIGDLPMTSYVVNRSGANLYEFSIWKSLNQTELDNLVRVLEDFQPDAVGLTMLTSALKLAAEVTGELRKHFNVPMLWGGTGPTLEPERCITVADLVCVGEGEEVITEIAERLDAGQSLDGIDGTWYRLPDESVQKNPKRPVSDLEEIARPSFDREHTVFITGDECYENFCPEDEYFWDRSYKMMTQRGCPFSCSFCVESVYQRDFGKKGSLRRMSPQKAIAELRYAKNELGYRTVTFYDDVFTIQPRWLDEFLALYRQEIGLPFFCYTYPTTHNLALLKKLREAGCHAITMGIQSGSDRILKQLFNRPTGGGRIVEAAREIVESGIPAATFDMIPKTGFDTEEDLQATFELLLQIPKEIDTSFYASLVYFPNYPIQSAFENQDLLAQSESLSPDVYQYYFKLFNLTRTPMPVEEIRAISRDPRYRENHDLLNPLLNDDHLLKPSYGTLVKQGMRRERKKRGAAAASASDDALLKEAINGMP